MPFRPHGFARPGFGGFWPDQKAVFVPARQAYSDSASVGRRQGLPSLRLSHRQKAAASCQLTPVAASVPLPSIAAAGRAREKHRAGGGLAKRIRVGRYCCCSSSTGGV